MKTSLLKRSIVLCALGLTLVVGTPLAKAEASKKTSLSAMMVADAFFGFVPNFSGTYNVSDTVGFSFYGIFWNAGKVGQAFGNWNEFGIGANLKLSDRFTLLPQFGLSSGTLLSANDAPTLWDGIVPNLTARYLSSTIEGELYAGLYAGIRGNQNLTRHYVHWWFNLGYRFDEVFSAGAHFEHLHLLGGLNLIGNNPYMVVGPYVQINAGSGFVRFSGLVDVRNSVQRTESGSLFTTFFKMALGYTI